MPTCRPGVTARIADDPNVLAPDRFEVGDDTAQ
jgi:hypothetical protein